MTVNDPKDCTVSPSTSTFPQPPEKAVLSCGISARRFASRLKRLGTETAYAVSAEAGERRAEGQTVYDFHIGDLNFKTPSIVIEAAKQALDAGKTTYCAPRGLQPLTETIARVIGKERGVYYSPEQVSIQPGGKPVILKFFQSVLEEGDEVLYPSPGYPIYESTVNFLGGVCRPYRFKDTSDSMKIDLEHLKSQIGPKTRVLVFNNFQNPTGAASTVEEMQELAQIAIENDLWVLSDEAYFHFVFDGKESNSIVSLEGMQERTCILLTASKSYAMTGWRLGAALGPRDLIAALAKLTTNDEACTTHFIQWAGIAAFGTTEAQEHCGMIKKELKSRRDLIHTLVNQVPGWRSHLPPSTFYTWVNVTEAMRILHIDDYESFRRRIMAETGIAFCTREHFGASLPGETEKYIRLAFSGITCDKIVDSLTLLKQFMTLQLSSYPSFSSSSSSSSSKEEDERSCIVVASSASPPAPIVCESASCT